LKKLDKAGSEAEKTAVYNWASFFNAKTEAELELLASKDPAIAEALVRLGELSEDEKMQKMAIATEQNRRYFADQLWGAKEEGRIDGRYEAAVDAVRKGVIDPIIVAVIGAFSEERAKELIEKFRQ
jgi:hypothetical protein